MNRFSDVVRERLGAFLGVGGFLGVGALVVAVSSPTPDAGSIAPLVAAAAEEVQVEVLNSGETFGGILNRTELTSSEQQALLLAFREYGDPSRLRVGTEISFRFTRDDGYLRGIDVALNADQIVRINRDQVGWYSSLIETPVWVDTLVVQGTIRTDLWTSFVGNQDRDPNLEKMRDQDRWEVVVMMDKVFQWQLDFYRQIHRGDSYSVAFEREVRPDGSMRSLRILAAEIINASKPVSAIWFDLKGDGIGGYYDRDGESLRRAFLSKPLEFRRISSRFSLARFHPTLNVTRPHNGVDYAAASGTEVMATSDGIVTVRGVSGGYGNLVEIRHSGGYVTRYAHLSRFASGIRVGGRVSQGEIIGYVGMTGLATGPHLHYELHKDGRPVDPMNLDLPQGDPIPAEARDRWNADLQARYALLGGGAVQSAPVESRMAEVPAGAAGTRGPGPN